MSQEQLDEIKVAVLARMGKKILKFKNNFSEVKSKEIIGFVNENWNKEEGGGYTKENLLLMLARVINDFQPCGVMPVVRDIDYNNARWVDIKSRLKRLDFLESKVNKTILGFGILGISSGLSLCVKDKVPFLLEREVLN